MARPLFFVGSKRGSVQSKPPLYRDHGKLDPRDLRSLQENASDLGREKHFRRKIGRMRRSKAWRDLGDLKRELRDL